MRYLSFEPSAHLKPYIKKYYYVEFDCQEHIKQCNLPASHAIMCFQIGRDKPTLLFEGAPPFTHRYYFAGPLRNPLYIKNPGRYDALIVLFTELGGYYLFKVPQIEYADQLLCLNELLGGVSYRIIDRIFSLHDTEQQVQSIEQFLSGCFDSRARSIPSLEYALEKITSTYCHKTITEICRELPCSLRTLERQFQYYIGTTPKEFARLFRLYQVYKSLTNYTPGNLHDLILRVGYYDQAHLIRDLKSYAGVTPKQFQEHARFIKPYLSE